MNCTCPCEHISQMYWFFPQHSIPVNPFRELLRPLVFVCRSHLVSMGYSCGSQLSTPIFRDELVCPFAWSLPSLSTSFFIHFVFLSSGPGYNSLSFQVAICSHKGCFTGEVFQSRLPKDYTYACSFLRLYFFLLKKINKEKIPIVISSNCSCSSFQSLNPSQPKY